eukprot:TRINITY_DN9391_c0_g4_i1.p1 TRINITY_DN9391_c0_g4~~TRINITY_DN9391_c0_g4_i1.p1  ORF type:complete len:1346 (+),score=588.12 TRINITY_DN9391_c0_g4_i1:72-4040(+)
MDEPHPQRAGKAHTTRLPAIRNVPNVSMRDVPGLRQPHTHPPRRSNVSDVDSDASGWDATWRKSAKGKLKCVTGHNMIHDADVHVGKRRGKNGEKVWFVDQKKPMPFWKRAEERIPKPLKSFDMRVYGPEGMKETKDELLAGWIENYQSSQIAYTSVATWAEVMLQKVITDTAHLTRPNPLRTAVCCMLLDKVTSLFGRYEGVVSKLKEELFASIYYDWPSNTELRDKEGKEKLPELLPLPAQPCPARTFGRSGSDVDTDDGQRIDDDPDEQRADQAADGGLQRRVSVTVADNMKMFATEHHMEPRKKLADDRSSDTGDCETPSYEGSRATVHVLNHKSTFYQVCRQLMFSQDSALTVDKSDNLSITDVLNAAITRWQRSILRIYFINWKIIKKTEQEKRRRALELGERLFSKRTKNFKKACFQGWRQYIKQKRQKKKANQDEIRSTGININMSRKLLELENGWNDMEEQLEYHQREHERCKATLLKMKELLKMWNRAGNGGEELKDNAGEEEDQDEEEEEEEAEDDSHAGAESDRQSEPEEVRAERQRELLDELDRRITEVIKAPGMEWERHLELVDEGGYTPPPSKKVEVKVVEKRAPYKDVLHWVNSRIHSLLHPSKKVTNFATDFASCLNYGYLLHSLGATSHRGPIVSVCADPHVDATVKAEIVIDACEGLLEESLEGVIKATDILKAKGAKNSALIFMLHKKFGAAPLPSTATKRAFAKEMNMAPPLELQLEDEGLLWEEQFSSSDDDDDDRNAKGVGPQEEDFERWLHMFPEGENYTLKEQRRRSSGDEGQNATVGTQQGNGQPGTAEGKIVTFGDVLSGEHGPGDRAGLDVSTGACSAGGAGAPTSKDPDLMSLQSGGYDRRSEKSKQSTPMKLQLRGTSPTRAAQHGTSKLQGFTRASRQDAKHPLIMWLNRHLHAAGVPVPAENFTTSLRDFASYAVLLEQLVPQQFRAGHHADGKARRQGVLAALREIDVSVVPPPEWTLDAANAPQKAVHAALVAEKHGHQIFLASLFAHFSTPEFKKSANAADVAECQVTVLLSPEEIASIIGEHLAKLSGDRSQLMDEAQACLEVLRRNLVTLQRIFVKYGSRGDWENTLDATGWADLAVTSGLQRYTTARFPPLRKLPLSEGTRMLLRTAAEMLAKGLGQLPKGATVSAALEHVVEEMLIPNTPMHEMKQLELQLQAPEVLDVIAQFTPSLRKLFLFYTGDAQGMLAFGTFHTLLRENQLLHPRKVSSRMASVAFACSQQHEGGLDFDAFTACLAMLSAFHNPMPFHGLEVQLERYLLPLATTILSRDTQARIKAKIAAAQKMTPGR